MRSKHKKLASRASVAILAGTLLTGIAVQQATARSVAVDPYSDVDWSDFRQFKTQLHAHTTQSDGRMSVPQAIDSYRELGYEILSITDHDRATWPWTAFGRDPDELGMLAIAGNELSRHHHVNSLFTDFTTNSRNVEEAIRGAIESGGIVMLNHPSAHWWNGWGMRSLRAPEPAVTVPTEGDLRAATADDFTVATWFRTTDGGRNILLGNFGASDNGVINLELHTGNRVRIYLQPTHGTVMEINQDANALGINTRDGQWHHLAARRTSSELALFLNGREVGRSPITSDAFRSFAIGGDRLYLGRDGRTGATTLSGDLDLVRFWGTGLSDEEIAKLAEGAAPSQAPAFERCFEALGADQSQQLVADVHPVLKSSGQSSQALSFGNTLIVTDEAVAFYRDLFEKFPEMFGMEVINGTRPLTEYQLDRGLWDALLGEFMPERPIWGTATDDMHSTAHLGREWIMVLAEELEESQVRTAIENGTFYFSSIRVRPDGSESTDAPPAISSIRHNTRRGELRVSAEVNGEPVPESAYKWISHGKVVHTGSRYRYSRCRELPEDARYLRLEIYGEGGTTFTNPIGFTASN